MGTLKRYLLPFLVLSSFIGLAISFRSFLITYVFEPTATLFWAAWRIVSSVNQSTYWLILIFICLISVIRIIPPGEKPSNRAYQDRHRPPDRVEYWRTLMNDAISGQVGAEFLRVNLKELLASIDKVDRSHSGNLPNLLISERAKLPMAVQHFLFPVEDGRKDYRLWLLSIIPKWSRRWTQPDNTALEETLKWMESTLEINNDQ